VSTKKLGTGMLTAFIRQGHKEISQVVPAFKDSIQVVEEPGQLNNLTPGAVDRQIEPEQNRSKESKQPEIAME
jgi:hypothetical protein